MTLGHNSIEGRATAGRLEKVRQPHDAEGIFRLMFKVIGNESIYQGSSVGRLRSDLKPTLYDRVVEALLREPDPAPDPDLETEDALKERIAKLEAELKIWTD